MATGKKSFILYCDIINTVAKLPDEQAGKLFKIILEYVNDNSPTVDDLLLQIAFEPIKQQLKRDLIQWENIIEKRVKAGKASADKRQHMLTHVESVEQNQQVSTVNDTVNVNVTVKKEKKDNTWRENFEIYLQLVEQGKKDLFEDAEAMKKLQLFNPSVDIKLSIGNSIFSFWGTPAGWKNKTDSRSKEINMKSTLIKNIGKNKVYCNKNNPKPEPLLPQSKVTSGHIGNDHKYYLKGDNGKVTEIDKVEFDRIKAEEKQ